MAVTIIKPQCCDCDKFIHHREFQAVKKHGVTMHYGERFCCGEKRARRFKRNDPKIYVPKWCPKRIYPYALRIYGFKDWLNEMVYIDLKKEKKTFYPSECSYSLRLEEHTELNASEYFEEGLYQEGITPRSGEVVEIDVGIKPQFFYNDGEKLVHLPYFNKSRISNKGEQLC